MDLAKAYITLVESDGKNPPTTTSSGTKIEFQFNPKQITMTRSANWRPKNPNVKRRPTVYEYRGPQPTKLELEMFLDASYEQNGDVSKNVDALLEACAPTDKSAGTGKPLPAFAIFGWDRVHFRGFIESVDVTYTMFKETGKPVRATCKIKLTEASAGATRQNPTSGGQAAQSIVQLVEGDSLAAIAYREYGDASMWREIAEVNSIDDPLRLKPGVRLIVPPAVEVVR